MPFYETVFETGSSSVGEYANDTEAISAAQTHHERAVAGEPGGPTEHPAERVVHLYKYDRHPAEYNATGTLSADEIANVVKSVSLGNEVSVAELGNALARAIDPIVDRDTPRQSSKYKMSGTEVTLPWL